MTPALRQVLFGGVRRNFVIWSEAFDNAQWTTAVQGSGLTPTVTANAAIAPNGMMVADVITFDANGTATGDRSRILQNSSNVNVGPNRVFTWSVELRSQADSHTLHLTLTATGAESRNGDVAVEVTPIWQRFSVIGATGAGGTTIVPELKVQGNEESGSIAIEAWGALLNPGLAAGSYVMTQDTPRF